MYRAWDQYSIVGLKIEYMPFWTQNGVSDPTVTANPINQLLMVSDPDDFMTMAAKTDSNIITGPGFRNLNPYRPYKKYISVKKLSKQMNVAWQDNQALTPTTPPPHVANTLTKAATLLRFNMAVAASNTLPLGNIKVTWFMHMRG